VQVPAGASLYLRVFPWNSAGAIGKTLAVYGVRVAGSVTSAPSFVDGTSSFSLLRSGLTWNRITNKYTGSITLTNTSGKALTGPFQVAFNKLGAGIAIDNASGTHEGAPYIGVDAATLAPGAALTVPVTFSNPNKAAIGYTNSIYIGTF
jgi:hypothetical protein